MGDFFQIASDLTKGFVEGFGNFWEWFTTPIIKDLDLSWLIPTLEPVTIAPWMILSFTSLAVIFTICLIKLIVQ